MLMINEFMFISQLGIVFFFILQEHRIKVHSFELSIFLQIETGEKNDSRLTTLQIFGDKTNLQTAIL